MAEPLDTLLDDLTAQQPIRAGSLIVSVFGDAITPRGGNLAMVSLMQIMRGFRVSDGLVRTALSRLVSDGWFARRKVGRNSFYRLTDHGRATFASAAEKIYGYPSGVWTGQLTLVLLPPGGERGSQRDALLARGYGALTADLLVTPAADDGADGALRFAAKPLGVAPSAVAERAWPLGDLAARYDRFITVFTPCLPRARGLSDIDALLLRVLIVHQFRRIVLRDPLLPRELLAPSWPGHAARRLAADLYGAVAPASERWLDANAADEHGPLPKPGRDVGARFATGR